MKAAYLSSLSLTLPVHLTSVNARCPAPLMRFSLRVGARQDALVLLGPFVDVEHPAVSSGSLDVTFEDLFVAQVCGRPRPGLGCSSEGQVEICVRVRTVM